MRLVGAGTATLNISRNCLSGTTNNDANGVLVEYIVGYIAVTVSNNTVSMSSSPAGTVPTTSETGAYGMATSGVRIFRLSEVASLEVASNDVTLEQSGGTGVSVSTVKFVRAAVRVCRNAIRVRAVGRAGVPFLVALATGVSFDSDCKTCPPAPERFAVADVNSFVVANNSIDLRMQMPSSSLIGARTVLYTHQQRDRPA